MLIEVNEPLSIQGEVKTNPNIFPENNTIGINPFTVIFITGNIKQIQLLKKYDKQGTVCDRFLAITIGETEHYIRDEYINNVFKHLPPSYFQDAYELYILALEIHKNLEVF